MTTSTSAPASSELRVPSAERRPPRRWPVGWAQAVALVVGTAVALRHYDVPLADTARFLLYLALGVTLPGTLLWRAVSRRPAPLIEDLAAGCAFGYALEVLTYIGARAVGLPLAVLAWPLLTLVAFLAVPGLRRYWRGRPGGEPAPWWFSWTTSAGIAFLAGWSCLEFFRSTRITAPGYTAMDYDMPFQLAIVGEVKHHVPPRVPWLISEPLYYHWFVHAEIAATSWVTGLEPMTLLYRLSPLPMLAVLAVLIGALARRLSGAWWSAPAAVAGTFLVLAPNPLSWELGPFFQTYGFGAIEDGSLLRPTLWNSTTQTFGCTLSVLLVMVLIDLLRPAQSVRPRRTWFAFGVLLLAVMGAKATYLPLLLAGLALVVAVDLVVRRRLMRPALLAGAIVLAALGFAQFVLFGGVSQGLSLDPMATMQTVGVASTTHFISETDRPLWRVVVVTGVCAAGWLAIWSGAAGLRRRLTDPGVLLLAGIGLAGLVGLLAFMHPGLSQYFFFESARPYLAVLAAAGLAVSIRPSRRSVAGIAAFLAAGAVVVLVVRRLGPAVAPQLKDAGAKPVALAIVWPYALLVLAAGVAFLAGRRWCRPLAFALVAAFVAGFGLPSGADQIRLQALTAPNLWRRAVEHNAPVTPGTMEAGRWLRDHSDPNDLVATNAHCRSIQVSLCDNHHFSVAAFTERRTLFESTGYTARSFEIAQATGRNAGSIPYWDTAVAQANDAAFAEPSAATIGILRDRYHVRWLFADELRQPPSPDLGTFATLHFRSGFCAVYEL